MCIINKIKLILSIQYTVRYFSSVLIKNKKVKIFDVTAFHRPSCIYREHEPTNSVTLKMKMKDINDFADV